MKKNLDLNSISLELKKKIIEISYLKKTHHIGSCLSCADIVVALFFGVMSFNKNTREYNDFFVMSKGHAALTYYFYKVKIVYIKFELNIN